MEWQTVDTAQPDQLVDSFGGLDDALAVTLSTDRQSRVIRTSPRSPALGAAVDGLRFLQQVVLPAPAAGRTVRLASRQAPAALCGPAASGSRKLEAAADGLQGLLRVAAAEVHGLSCASVMLDPGSCLQASSPDWQQMRRVSPGAQAPAYADGHGAACTGGAWSAPRLLPAASSSAGPGQNSAIGIPMQGCSAHTAQFLQFS